MTEEPNTSVMPWRHQHVEPPRSRLRVGIAAVLLTACTAVILAVTLRPRPVTEGNRGVIDRVLAATHSAGVPSAFDYNALEFTANIAMFVPFGLLLALMLSWRVVWAALLIVPLFSGAIETAQALFLSARFGTLEDVMANTIGGWIGIGLAVALRALVRARDERVIARALYFARTDAPAVSAQTSQAR